MASPPPKLRHVLPFPDKIRLFLWKQFRRSYSLALRIKNGPRITLRANFPHDAGIAREIFAEKIYALPPSLAPFAPSIKTIADAGANIGYSMLYFQSQFQNSHIIAFEPHPAHIAAIQQHFDLNATESSTGVPPVDSRRLTLHSAAAGTAPGQLFLTDDGAASAIVSTSGDHRLPVPIIDFFTTLGLQRIDLLKMDIEGGEYPLLADPRFAGLDLGIIVMEAHATSLHPDGFAWCLHRLGELGYAIVQSRPAAPGSGMIWAQHN